MELCPICIDKEATIFTECNHRYCACCISRIKKCSMCSKPLQHNKLCNELKRRHLNNYRKGKNPIFNYIEYNNGYYLLDGQTFDEQNRTVFYLDGATMIGRTIYFHVTLPEMPETTQDNNIKTMISNSFNKLINGLYSKIHPS